MTKYHERIAALLRKAESTDSPAEAEALTEKAEQLMIKWGISELITDTETKRKAEIRTVRMTYSEVGAKYLADGMAQLFGHQIVAGLLGDQARCIIETRYDRRKILVVVGFDRDMDRLNMLHDSLVLQALYALEAWRATADVRYLRSVQTAADHRRDQIQFMWGFAHTVKTRLEAMRVQEQEQAEVGTALAVRSSEVEDRFQELYPSVQQARGLRAGSHAANEAGRRAGATAHFGHSLGTGSTKAIR